MPMKRLFAAPIRTFRWVYRRLAKVHPLLLVVIVMALVRLATLGTYPLMDTTEARYGAIARLMTDQGDWITPWFRPGVPFWGKPPLSFWCTELSFRLFGVNEFTARLPHWILGVVTGGVVWGLAMRRSLREALLAVALLSGCLLFFVASGAVWTDMALTLGMTVTMASFWLVVQPAQPDRLSRQARWWFFISLGWGLLAKGPVALALSALSIAAWLVLSPSHWSALARFPWVRGVVLTSLIAGPWYWAAEQRTPGFLNYFLVGEHFQRFLVPGWQGDLYGTAHLYPRGTIWLFLLYMLMPWTILVPLFLWRQLWGTLKTFIIQLLHRPSFLPDPVHRGPFSDLPHQEREWRLYLICWGLTPVLFFTFSANIIMPYVLPGIPALALLGASHFDGFDERRIDRLLFTGLSMMLVGSFLFVLVFPFTGYGERKSQRSLIQLYEQFRAPESQLVYFGQYPFSAGFYSNHSVSSVFDLPHLTSALDQSGSLFVALPKNPSPELRHLADRRLERVGPSRRFTLYRERPPSGSG